MPEYRSVLGEVVNGMLRGHQLGQQMKFQQLQEEAMIRQAAREQRETSIQDIMLQNQEAEREAKMIGMGARRVTDGMVDDTFTPTDSTTAFTSLPGTPIVRKAKSPITFSGPSGKAQWELPTAEEQAARSAKQAAQQKVSELIGTEQASEIALKHFGVLLPPAVATTLGLPPDTKVMKAQLPDLVKKAADIEKGGAFDLAPGAKRFGKDGSVLATNAPLPPKPSGDFAAFGSRYATKYKNPDGTPKTLEELDADEITEVYSKFNDSKDHAQKTAAGLAVLAGDENADPKDRAAATNALKILEKHSLASRPVTNVFNPPAATGTGPVTAESVPARMRGQVQAISEYRSPMPAMGRNNPFSQELAYWVHQVNPSYDGTQFQARNKTQSAFASGKEAQNITSINTAIGHLGSLYDSAGQLGNTSFRGYNSFGNWLSKQTGKDTVKPFELAHAAVAEELGRAFKGGIATQGEVATWEKAINDADSPQQLRTSIKTITELLASRIHALEDQYESSMGKGPDKSFVREKSQQVLDRIGGGASAPGATGPATHRWNPATRSVEAIK